MYSCYIAFQSGQSYVFFFQAEDGIRDLYVTGVQTCALPISVEEAVGVKRRTGDVERRVAPQHRDPPGDQARCEVVPRVPQARGVERTIPVVAPLPEMDPVELDERPLAAQLLQQEI